MKNRKNIKAAYIIWNKQSEYLEKKYINRAEDLKKVLPDYLISAIIYVTKG